MLRRRYLDSNNKILDDIFTEWRLLTKGGVPYVKEPYHLVLLERAMNNLNLPSWFDKKWDPVLKRKADKEILDSVNVEFFRYNNYSHTVGSFAVEADIVAYSEVEGGQDWALLRVRD